MVEDLNKRIEVLANWMYISERLVVFTGAGISTDSGIPDKTHYSSHREFRRRRGRCVCAGDGTGGREDSAEGGSIDPAVGLPESVCLE